MTRNLLCLASAGIALTFLAGCNAASTATPAAASHERVLKTNTEQSGKPNFVSADIAANGVATCTDVHSTTLCYVKMPGQMPVNLKKGESLTASTAGKLTLSCNGSGPEFCEVTIKD
jgi:hypothetical protein